MKADRGAIAKAIKAANERKAMILSLGQLSSKDIQAEVANMDIKNPSPSLTLSSTSGSVMSYELYPPINPTGGSSNDSASENHDFGEEVSETDMDE
jgi:hypothetical protein